MTDLPDVDLEVRHRERVVPLFLKWAKIASQAVEDRLVRHNSGLYFQDIPSLPDGMAAYPYDIAEAQGFYKVDLLSAPNPYDGIESMEQLHDLLDRPIDWSRFRDIEFVKTLFHLNGTVYMGGQTVSMAEVVAYYKPESIPDVAAMVAIKMPAKKYLIGDPWETIRKSIYSWEPADAGPRFKKSHAIAYALAVSLKVRT